MIPGVPSQAEATAQISQGLQNQGFDPSQANQIAEDITDTATWGDITAARAMQKALQGGNSTLSPGQMGAVHNFINRLPKPDRAHLNGLVKKVLSWLVKLELRMLRQLGSRGRQAYEKLI